MSLPGATSERWQPLRCGLVELYHYDVEEFAFRDGHLLLRGNNGTGKSKVLSLLLPFLLDANLSSSRVEPDGDRGKRMEWNLLMGGRYERRTGYTWIEFGRRDETGGEQTLTLGCGLRAVAGRSGVEPWYFITDQRIGHDLWLATADRVVLSKERLVEAIGAHGQVFRTAESYRRAVDERLFQLGSERYGALIDTLIQLRQPQLSRQPNEQRLSDALTESLAPLDRAALESVAEAMGQLEDLRRDLDELTAMRDAVASFGRRYRRYAGIATRRRARVLRQAQTEFDNASRERAVALEALEEAKRKVEQWRAEEQRLGEQLVAGRARLEVLQADPVMRDARRLHDARAQADQCRRHASDAEQRAVQAEERLAVESERVAKRSREADGARAALVEARDRATAFATDSGVGAEHERLIGAATLTADECLRAARDIAQRRREQVGVVRARLAETRAAEQVRNEARSRRDDRADALDAAREAARECEETCRRVAETALEAWQAHARSLAALELDDVEALLAELEAWLDSLYGANPLRAALDAARAALETELAAREAALRHERDALAAEQAVLHDEQVRLERGEDTPPPAPHTRDPESRSGRPGAPLWKLIDFAPGIDARESAGLEAALEASGLLDAWVLPDGTLVDARTHDVVLVPRAPVAPSLADRLVVSLPPGIAPVLNPSTVEAVLGSIACAGQAIEDAEAWVSPRGEFRIGALRGAWSKDQAVYIGHAAREAARRARLDEIGARLAAIGANVAECEAGLERCAASRAAARDEHANAPSDEPLLRAAADRSAAEERRRDAQARLGETETQLSSAEQALTEARERLSRDARDLGLPDDSDDLDRIDASLGDYRQAALELANALRHHARAVEEFDEQAQRETQARADAEASAAGREETRLALRAAEETVAALEGTVGKQVEELLGEIEQAKRANARDQEAEKRARAELNVASTNRGVAENERKASEAVLVERTAERKAAVAALETFTVETQLLAVALGEEFEIPPSPWGVDAALGVARRAEQALARLAADDADWSRVQSEVGRDLTDLQNAMSARGLSATAEPSDHGLIVRIVHEQRPERPDVLERRIEAELADRRLLLTEREREVLEQHLEKEIAANLQRMIHETEQRVTAMNRELAERPTSTGVRYRLAWQPLPEESADGVPGLVEARRRLLRTSADAWSADDRHQVGEFLQSRIAAEMATDDHSTLHDSLVRALDYRRWHRFRVQRLQDGQWRPLTGPASSGERALGLTVPLFAAASSHYESAGRHAPRLVLLDEAFAGIDDEARASCMALIRQFDLDFVMTSEREWGCYAALPGLAICQLVRREGVDAVHVSRWTWDGRARVRDEEPAARFPQADREPARETLLAPGADVEAGT